MCNTCAPAVFWFVLPAGAAGTQCVTHNSDSVTVIIINVGDAIKYVDHSEILSLLSKFFTFV